MALPELGELHERKIVESTTPEAKAKRVDFKFLRDALTGGGGFAPYNVSFESYSGTDKNQLTGQTYLRKYPRENAEKWRRRVKNAYYPNYIDFIVKIWIGLFTRETPARDGYPPSITDWMDHASADGKKSLDTLISDLYMYWWFGYGEMYALVNGPDKEAPDAPSAAHVTTDVYLTPVHPDRVLMAPEVNGKLAYFKYETELPASTDPLAPGGEKGKRIYILTTEGSWYYDIVEGTTAAEVPVMGVAPWEGKILGTVPVARLKREDGQPSPIHCMAQAMTRLYNVLSMLGEVEDLTCFPVLAWPCRSPEEFKSLDWGASTAIPFPAEFNAKPEFIGYDAAPLTHLVGRAEMLVSEIKGLSSLMHSESGNVGASGLARAFAFLQTDRTIMSFVASLEAFDLEIASLVSLWKGAELPDEAKPGYPRSFDVQEVAEAMEGAQALLDMQLEPHQARLTKQAAFNKYHQSLSNEDVQKVDSEFDAMEKDLEAEGADDQEPLPVPGEAEPGVPTRGMMGAPVVDAKPR